MNEMGFDISDQRSKTIDEISHIEFDYVITLCDNAKEFFPIFPAKTKVIHHAFDDPYMLSLSENAGQNKLLHFRRIRDEIRIFIVTIINDLVNK